MYFLQHQPNLNLEYFKAAAPNNGAAAFFFSTNYSVLHHVSPFFGDENFAGYPSKKAKLRTGDFSLAMAKKVEKQGIMTIILFFAC